MRPITLLLPLLLWMGCTTTEPKTVSATEDGRCVVQSRWAAGTLTYCAEYNGIPAASLGTMAQICRSENDGSWTTGRACPVAGRSGACDFEEAGFRFSYNYYPDFEPADARRHCAGIGGSWRRTIGAAG